MPKDGAASKGKPPNRGKVEKRKDVVPLRTRASKSPTCAVVGMGASAGGFEALRVFFQKLPADCGMAFVLVPHLDPRHESVLAELLARHTALPVEQVRRPAEILPNHVYVMSPGAPLTIKNGVLAIGSRMELPRAPIDHFFRSLAEDQGENAICIVLSGTGSDGSLGLTAVKEHGGLTIAQSSHSARYDSMPRSAVATGLVDQVLSVEEMPAKLLEYVRHLGQLQQSKGPDGAPEDAGANLVRIIQLLKQGTGNDFSLYKKSTLIRRIQRRMQVTQSATAGEYLDRLGQDKKELDKLFRDLLIGVTHFFRDPDGFAVLAKQVIPRLFNEKGPQDHVRVWVSACATGEEAYSIAILLAERLAKLRNPPRVQVFATDIDDEALEIARQARYREGIVDQVQPARLQRFFTKEAHHYQVNKEVRELIVFSHHNMTRDPPFSRVDLISCRNLLIYFENDLQRRLTALFQYSLSPGGFLFLGSSENVIGPTGVFRVVDKKHRIFQRKHAIAPQLPGFPLGDAPFGRLREPLGAPGNGQRNLMTALERILLEQLAPASVVVDEQGTAIYFSGRTGKYLEQGSGAPSTDVVSMARKGLRSELRRVLHQAKQDRRTVVQEGVKVQTNGGHQRINLIVRPLLEMGEEANLFLVVFQDQVERRGRARPQMESSGITEELEIELRSTKDHLQTTIEELETSNEQLKSSNEELLSMNEELQSANEELQTSKEELQSVNEELETVNTEASLKVDELDSVNSDLQNLLQSTQIATLFLSHDLRINRFTAAATDIFHLIDSDVGRPITDITARIEGQDLQAEVRQVLRSLVPRERPVRLVEREGSYLMRIYPYRTVADVIEGVVVTFVDITELERSREQVSRLAAIVNASSDAIFSKDLECRITSWNAGAEKIYGWSAAEMIGQSVVKLTPPELREQPAEIVQRLKRGAEVVDMETVRMRKDGTRIDVWITCSPIRGERGELLSVSVIARDVTGRNRGRRDLVRVNADLRRANEDLQQLAYATSHDLQEPLRMVSNYAQLLERTLEPTLDERSRGFLNNVIGGTTRLGVLLHALQEYWSVDHSDLEYKPVDANAVLQQAIRNVKAAVDESGAEVSSKGLPTLLLDETPLLQVFQNLLSNALKYRKQGVPPRVLVSAREDDGVWEFSVADNGQGVPEKHREHIFHPFRRLHGEKIPGAGMGLAICARIVGFFGGRIWVDGNTDGATIKFTVPNKRHA